MSSAPTAKTTKGSRRCQGEESPEGVNTETAPTCMHACMHAAAAAEEEEEAAAEAEGMRQQQQKKQKQQQQKQR